MNKNKGITLIALVITIIILIILAGISVATLTGDNGLFSRAKQAKEEYEYKQAKEKLQIEIMEFKSNNIQNINLMEFRQFLVEKNIDEYEISDILEERLNVYNIKYKCSFAIDSELNVIEDDKIVDKTQAIYEIKTIDDGDINITIVFKNLYGIKRVKCPNGNIIDTNNKKQIGVDYKIKENSIYEFIVVTENSEDIMTLNSNYINQIEINETTAYAYPVITKNGVEIGKNVSINYTSEGDDNLYSMDDGKTWQKYTGKIKINNECTIKAKKNC